MSDHLRIAVASGKGGTGKTTLATSLALCLAAYRPVLYLDCDVEAPNGHLFLKPDLRHNAQAAIRIPRIRTADCTACGRCVEVCQFHALAQVGRTVMVFPQLCHGCGSCTWNCPQQAIAEVPHPIGVLEWGPAGPGLDFARGVLTISEPMPTPIIRQLKRLPLPNPAATVILDSPPGASCSVMETLRGADFVLLVTEPTAFGLHDLRQMLGIVQEMGLPAGLVINRDGPGVDEMEAFLAGSSLPVLLRIPFSQELAAGIAAGRPLVEVLPEYGPRLLALFERVQAQVKEGAHA